MDQQTAASLVPACARSNCGTDLNGRQFPAPSNRWREWKAMVRARTLRLRTGQSLYDESARTPVQREQAVSLDAGAGGAKRPVSLSLY